METRINPADPQWSEHKNEPILSAMKNYPAYEFYEEKNCYVSRS